MAEQNFGKQLAKIGWGGFTDTMSDYFSNVSSIKSDADTIKSQIIQDGKTVFDVFERMKKSGKSPAKKLRDWFYSNEMGMGGFGDDNDDFDAGFKPDSADDAGGGEEKARSLTADDMTDIAKKQAGEASKLATKQAELNIANTAEIVSAINSRSSEQLAAINKINDTLMGISKKLDGMIGYMAEEGEKEKKKASLMDSHGNISLTGMFNAGRETVMDKASYLEMAKTFSMMLTPQFLAGQGIDKLLSQKIDALGDRSIKAIAESIDNAIGDTLQSGMMALLKNDKFNDLFGIGDVSKNVNYQKFVTNDYSTKPAVFDGMTRKTIIHIIPEYLKSIEAAITGGAPKSVNDKGQLTTKQENYFQNTVGDTMFKGSVLGYGNSRSTMLETARGFSNNENFTSSQLETAAKALAAGYQIILLNGISSDNRNNLRSNANSILSPDEISYDHPTTIEAMGYAKMMLEAESKGQRVNWDGALKAIIITLSGNSRDARKFAADCTNRANAVRRNAEQFAKTHSHKDQAGEITTDLIRAVFHNLFTDRHVDVVPSAPTTAQNPSNKPTPVTAADSSQPVSSSTASVESLVDELVQTISSASIGTSIGSKDEKNGLTITEYLGDIFGILNRGLNVYVVGSAKGKGPGPYKPYQSNIKQGSSGGSVQNSVAAAVAPVTNAASTIHDAVDTITGHVEVETAEGQSELAALEEAYKNTPKSNILKRRNLRSKINKERKAQGLQPIDQTPTTVRGAAESAENTARELGGTVYEAIDKTELGHEVLQNERVQKAGNWFSTKYNALRGKFFGSDETDEEGNVVHTEGGADKAQAVIDKNQAKAKSKVNSAVGGFFNFRAKAMGGKALREKSAKDMEEANRIAEENLNNANESGDSTSQKEAMEDQATAQMLNTVIQIAQQDGDLSSSELQKANQGINSLHNKDLKAKYTRYIMPLLRQQANKTSAKSGTFQERVAGQKGILGTVFGQIAKYSAMIFKPITSILGKGVKLLFGISGILFKLSGKLIKSGAQNVYYGAKSLSAGLFGSKKEGEESLGMIKRILFMPDRLFKTFNTITKNFFTRAAETVDTVVATAAKLISNVTSAITSAIGKGLKTLHTAIFDSKNGLLAKISNSKVGQWMSGKLTSLTDKVSSLNKFPLVGQLSGFATGFTSAYREQKAAKNKARTESLAKSAPQSKTEAEVETIRTTLSDFKLNIKEIWDGFLPKIQEIIDLQTETRDAIESSSDDGSEGGSTDGNSESGSGSGTSSAGSSSESSSEGSGESGTRGGVSTPESASGESGQSGQAKGGSRLGNFIRGVGDKASDAVGAIRGKGNMGIDLGHVLGGISTMLGGIGKIILGAVAGLSGFKAIMTLIQNTLTNSLKPLNNAFQKVVKVLKPVLKTVQKSLASVAHVVSDIAISLVETLTPILEDIVGPLFEKLAPIIVKIGEILESLMPVINVILNTILMPIVTKLIGVLIPAVELIADVVQAVAGISEMIVGGIMWLAGIVTSVVGALLPLGGSSISSAGENLQDSGKNMMTAGWEMAKSAFSGLVSTTIGAFKSLIVPDQEEEEEETKTEEKKKKEPEKMQGSILEGYVGNGDVNTTNNYYNTSTGQVGDINNMYGSGESQASYGGYLGMSKHGCGPTALADAVSRRSGRNISASGLARAMSGNGTYSSSRGTSVAGFMSASNAMGSRVTPGGVTSASLGRASANNPVTLFGSGSGFGTKSGNNHYVNVVGSNGRGTSYVSNPLTGRIERRSTSDLVNNSVLGLYGSGDDGSGDYYSFPEAIQDAMNELKTMAAGLLKMFTGNTAEEQLQEDIQKEKNETALKEAKKTLGDEYDAYEEEARQLAYADYEEAHPKLDSQTDEEYTAKKEAYFQNNLVKYLAKTKVFSDASEKGGNIYKNIMDMSTEGMTAASSKISGSAYGKSSGGGSGIYGEEGTGTAKMFDFGTITNYETNITSGESGESPVHDFFGAMGGAASYSSSNYQNWFSRRTDPDSSGTGHSGDSHYGVDIQWEGGNEGRPLYAITGGTVTDYRLSESGGNMIRWRDNSNKYEHVYMHMQDLPANLKAGDTIEAGTLVGHVGNTGASGGAHLHYGIYPNSSTWTADVNPLTYWKYRKGVDLPGDTNRDKIWAYLVAPQSAGGLGISKAAAAGILANMKEESQFEPRREEGNYDNPITDTTYNDNVDAGKISRSTFENDEVGFGLVQWTPYDRKTLLYDNTIGSGTSIGDLVSQLDFFKSELETRDQYSEMLNNMRNNPNYTHLQAMEDFLRKYEIPADIPGNVSIRGPYATEILDYYANKQIPTSLDASIVEEAYQSSTPTVGSGYVSSSGSVSFSNAADANNYMNSRPNVGDEVYLSANAVYTAKVGNMTSKDMLETWGRTGWKLEKKNGNGTYKISKDGRSIDIAEGFVYKVPSSATNMAGTSTTTSSGTYSSPYGNKNAKSGDQEWYQMSKKLPETLFSDVAHREYDVYKTNPRFYTGNAAYDVFNLSEKMYKASQSAPYYLSDNQRTEFKSLMGYDLTNWGTRYGDEDYFWSGLFRGDSNTRLTDKAYNGTNGEVISATTMKNQSPSIGYGNYYAPLNKSFHYVRYNTKGAKMPGYAIYDKQLASSYPLKNYLGSGDVSDFDIESYVGEDNAIPPIDSDKAFWDNWYGDTTPTSTGTTVNNYNLQKADDTETDARINAILNATFEVKSQSIEAKLQQIIDNMTSQRTGNVSIPSTAKNKNLFTENIPTQISRLSIG